MIKIVLKNISRRKARAILTILGIVIGVGAIVSLVAISEGLDADATEALGKMSGIEIMQEGAVDMPFSILPESMVDEIKKIRGVKLVNPQVMEIISTIDGEDAYERMFPVAVGAYPDKMLESQSFIIMGKLVRGRELTSNDKYAAVIGEMIADGFYKDIGSKIEVEDVELKVVGIYATGSRFMDNAILVHIDTAREIANMDEKTVRTIHVDAENPEEVDELAERIRLTIGGVTTKTSGQMLSDFASLMSTIKVTAWITAGIAGIVGGIGIMNSMLMNVMERRREIGVLKAVGWTDKDVMLTFLYEAVIIGLVGGVIGVLLGATVVAAINAYSLLFKPAISAILVTEAMSFALVLGIIGGLYPAWKTAKISPIEALRYE